MNTLQRMLKKRTATGSAAVEFAFILPLLVLLALPIFDFARVIQANMILINLSREGANLASRSSQTPQTIMNALAATAPPLNMGSNGMIYITKVMGNKEGNSIRNVIVQQDKWLAGSYAPASTLWNCAGGWTDGSCNGISANPNDAPIANVMKGQLADGEVIYVVEGFYNAGNMLFSAMNLGFGITTPQLSPNLHAMTIF
jgi:hypothetical protein